MRMSTFQHLQRALLICPEPDIVSLPVSETSFELGRPVLQLRTESSSSVELGHSPNIARAGWLKLN